MQNFHEIFRKCLSNGYNFCEKIKSFGLFLAKLWPFLYIMTSSDKSADVGKNIDVTGNTIIFSESTKATL